MKVCHLTSAHPRNDIRIFIKECKALATAGYVVSLVVADGKGDEVNSGIKILDAGKSSGRISRMTKTVWQVYKHALGTDADIYHFHDPELIFVAYLLKLKNKKVIYDVHEDLPRQLKGKHYLGKFSASVLAFFAELIEDFFAKRFTAIITVTPFIYERFQKLNPVGEMICNFPRLEEFNTDSSVTAKENTICYVGSITEERGIIELLKALEKIDTRLNLVGTFVTEELRNRMIQMSAWEKVNETGLLGRTEVAKIIVQSKVGLSVLRELPNYVNAYPIKIFEYMAAGIPVVASDFLLWKEIVEGNNCGICVAPDDVNAIADAVKSLLKDESRAKQMGENGKKAVKEKYNWEAESKKLLAFYEKLKLIKKFPS
jgi:glycosyltransferase involved in cell wall biosynthesis